MATEPNHGHLDSDRLDHRHDDHQGHLRNLLHLCHCGLNDNHSPRVNSRKGDWDGHRVVWLCDLRHSFRLQQIHKHSFSSLRLSFLLDTTALVQDLYKFISLIKLSLFLGGVIIPVAFLWTCQLGTVSCMDVLRNIALTAVLTGGFTITARNQEDVSTKPSYYFDVSNLEDLV